MSFALRAVAVFAFGASLSALWALYFRYSNAKRPFAAANADLLLVIVSAANVIGYTTDHRLLVPYLAGTWIGTYFAIRSARDR